MTELDTITAQQQRDDTTYQDPQRFAGMRTVSFEHFPSDRFHADDTPVRSGNWDHKEGHEPPRGTWRPNRVHPVHRPRTIQDRDTLFQACEDLLTDLPTDKEQTVREVVYGQRSQRGAAAFFGVSQPAIFKRLKTAYAMMRIALEARSGSAGMDFPGSRPFDESSKCRAPKCEGHFEPADCDCGTVLPRHYNPHTSCRTHTAATTRAEFNQAFLLGAATRGGREARSAAAPNVEAVAS